MFILLVRAEKKHENGALMRPFHTLDRRKRISGRGGGGGFI